jgi:hypothetical protein
MAFDGVIKTRFVEDGDKIYHEQTQPADKLIYERNAELRKNTGAIRDFGSQSSEGTWGREVARIPMNDLEWAKRNGYDIYSPDAKVASKELMRFLQSPIGQKSIIRDDPIIQGRRTNAPKNIKDH